MRQRKKILTVTLNPALDLACTVPDFRAGEVNRASASRLDAGGKGVNIARLLRLFELPVTVTGFLGADNPQLFEKLFREQSIEDAFVRVPGETRIGIKILDPTSHTTTDLNLPGLAPDASHRQRLLEVVEEQAQTAAIVIIAGSLPAGLAPDILGQLIALAKARGTRVFVDTSGEALRQALRARPSLVKPNRDELGAYVGRPLRGIAEVVAEARKLVATGIETVVVSLGAEGAVFVDRQGVVQTRPPAIDAVSTVGAGDAMVGSLAAGWVRQLSLAEGARLATAVSAAVVTQAGPGLSSLAAVPAIQSQVQVAERPFEGGADE